MDSPDVTEERYYPNDTENEISGVNETSCLVRRVRGLNMVHIIHDGSLTEEMGVYFTILLDEWYIVTANKVLCGAFVLISILGPIIKCWMKGWFKKL